MLLAPSVEAAVLLVPHPHVHIVLVLLLVLVLVVVQLGLGQLAELSLAVGQEWPRLLPLSVRGCD